MDSQFAKRASFPDWSWFSILVLTSALGMALVSFAFANSRDGGTGLRAYLYPGLLLIFTPTAIRLLAPAASRVERVALLCITGVSCYLIKVMSSPIYFSTFNEFLHWRTAEDITRSGHLFSSNALLPVSPFYPGLEIVTNALSTLSGFDTFHCGLIVVGVARILMVLALFVLNERLLQSARTASIATLLYMTNPEFFFYNSQFAYESLAIPLATLVIAILAPSQSISVRLRDFKGTSSLMMFPMVVRKRLKSDLRLIRLAALIVLVAIVLTHHVTGFFLDGLLVMWAVIYGLLHYTPTRWSNLALIALLGVLMSVAWASFDGNPVVNYLTSFLEMVLNEFRGILDGTGSARHLFITYAGPSSLGWERLLVVLSIALITLCLPFGLLCIWQHYCSDALIYTFGIIALFYPLSQVLRFTDVGASLAGRVATPLFIAISSVLAIFITQFWPTRRLNWMRSLLIACTITVLFSAGMIQGAEPGLATLPGPYLVAADSRSIEPEGIQAALWTRSYLGSNNRIGTDRTNQVLMGTYGDQRIVTVVADKIDLAWVFFSPRLGPEELSMLRNARPRYLVVDLRLAQSPPLVGFYFVEGEPYAFQHTTPIPVQSLTKFNTIPQINRVFDSGDIVIYDVEGFINAS